MSSRRKLRWERSWRIVRTIYPPVRLFEDVADPSDCDLLASAFAKTNPAVLDAIGALGLVPASRRLSGPGASLVMGTFTHPSPLRPSRFSDGRYGAWYCGDRFEVALAETAHHFERFMKRTNEPPGEADLRELTCAVGGQVATSDDTAILDPHDHAAGQVFGRSVREGGGDGVLYRSVRHTAGLALALFWPDCISLPVLQPRQFRYGWNGTRMHRYFIHGSTAWTAYP